MTDWNEESESARADAAEHRYDSEGSEWAVAEETAQIRRVLCLIAAELLPAVREIGDQLERRLEELLR